MLPQQYCLRWKHHHSNVQSMFSQLLEKERFCDVTLYCSASFGAHLAGADTDASSRGVSLRAHRVVLAACSELLGSLLGAHEGHGEPVLVIDGAEPKHVRALLDYMYTGEMNVHHSQLASLLKTAEELRIKGLSDIRWNNKDEPPDCQTGAVMATTTEQPCSRQSKRDASSDCDSKCSEKYNVNGGPPPLIKLPSKDKGSPQRRREGASDNDGMTSPKRKRMTSGTDNTDDDEHEQDWNHVNMDLKLEEQVQWPRAEGDGGAGGGGGGDESSSDSDDWADAPTDIGSFLHTRLRVDGDNSADEDSSETTGPLAGQICAPSTEPKLELTVKPLTPHQPAKMPHKPAKASSGDPRFGDVVKLNEYLLHGRRPQFWEEDYVKRVMEAVRLKELEMKQAAEILGVSYGTLYGRYRDVYGCINRPYRSARDFWAGKGPSEVLDRLQRGDVSVEVAAHALGVSVANLASHVADFPHHVAAISASVAHHVEEKDFEPIPIEIDPSLKIKGAFNPSTGSSSVGPCPVRSIRKNVAAAEKAVKRILIGSLDDDDIPATVITGGKWPSIRVANIDTLRGAGVAASTATEASASTSPPVEPTLLMKSRPDLTIVAAKKPEKKDQENGT